MPTCPKGHDSSAGDYCDHCGTPIAGATATAAPRHAPAGPGTGRRPLPGLRDTPESGRFCEIDGHDFLAASLGGTSARPDPPAPPGAAWIPGRSAEQRPPGDSEPVPDRAPREAQPAEHGVHARAVQGGARTDWRRAGPAQWWWRAGPGGRAGEAARSAAAGEASRWAQGGACRAAGCRWARVVPLGAVARQTVPAEGAAQRPARRRGFRSSEGGVTRSGRRPAPGPVSGAVRCRPGRGRPAGRPPRPVRWRPATGRPVPRPAAPVG